MNPGITLCPCVPFADGGTAPVANPSPDGPIGAQAASIPIISTHAKCHARIGERGKRSGNLGEFDLLTLMLSDFDRIFGTGHTQCENVDAAEHDVSSGNPDATKIAHPAPS